MVSTAEMSDQVAVTGQSGRKAVSSTTQQLLERASETWSTSSVVMSKTILTLRKLRMQLVQLHFDLFTDEPFSCDVMQLGG